MEMWGAPPWDPTFPPPLPPTTQAPLLSRELGKHLLEVEDLLQKHALLEADIAAQSERVRALNSAALRFTELEGNGGHHRGGGVTRAGGHQGWGVTRAGGSPGLGRHQGWGVTRAGGHQGWGVTGAGGSPGLGGHRGWGVSR